MMGAEITGVIFFLLLVGGVVEFFKLLSRGLDAGGARANRKNMLAAWEDCQERGGYWGIAPNGQKIFFPDTQAYKDFDEARTKRESEYYNNK